MSDLLLIFAVWLITIIVLQAIIENAVSRGVKNALKEYENEKNKK